jgi:hypothetical protein
MIAMGILAYQLSYDWMEYISIPEETGRRRIPTLEELMMEFRELYFSLILQKK